MGRMVRNTMHGEGDRGFQTQEETTWRGSRGRTWTAEKSKRDYGNVRCLLHAGATLPSVHEGTRAGIISSAHPGDIVDVDQRGAAE